MPTLIRLISAGWFGSACKQRGTAISVPCEALALMLQVDPDLALSDEEARVTPPAAGSSHPDTRRGSNCRGQRSRVRVRVSVSRGACFFQCLAAAWQGLPDTRRRKSLHWYGY